MTGIRVTGDYFDKAWRWPPDYSTLSAILGPAMDFLAEYWWATEDARLNWPRDWYDAATGRRAIPSDSQLKAFEGALIPGSGEPRIVGPGALRALADLVSADGSLLPGSADARFAPAPGPATAIEASWGIQRR